MGVSLVRSRPPVVTFPVAQVPAMTGHWEG
jgi:hypothetical protein